MLARTLVQPTSRLAHRDFTVTAPTSLLPGPSTSLMATISVSPTPVPIVAMSSRRAPLTNNPNAANSPLRGHGSLHAYAKQKRSHANVQREEAYGQPPPAKKQALDSLSSQRVIRSPSRTARTTQVLVQRAATASRSSLKERSVKSTQAHTRTAQDVDAEKEVWKKHHRAKFPKMVFYFESIPDDVRAKLTKRVTFLGAVSKSKAFSISLSVETRISNG